ncbi:MAG: ABC transporter permease [Planctomycetes bacterium]|nr:ABC transporter permease [Planctomycetota bacterium]
MQDNETAVQPVTQGAHRRLFRRARQLYEDAAPMLIKELRGYFRSKKFLITLSLMLLAYAVIFFIAVFSTFLSQDTVDLARVGTAGFEVLTVCNMVVVFVILPAFGAMSIIREKKEQTIDVLLTTVISPAQIVWGKFVTILTYAFVFFAASFPLVVISYMLGGITISNIIFEYACLMIMAVMLIMMSICISSATPNIVSAIASTYIVSGLLSILGFGAVFGAFRFARHGSMFDTDVLKEITRSFIVFFNAAVIPFLAYILIFAFFFTMAVNTLKSFSDNKTTSFKKLYVFFAFVFGLSYMVNAINELAGVSAYWWWYTRDTFNLYFGYLAAVAAITTFFSFFIITKEVLLSQHMHFRTEEIRKASFFRYIFQPGILPNVYFCIMMHLVMIAFLVVLPISGIILAIDHLSAFFVTLTVTIIAPLFFIALYMMFTLLLKGLILRRILAGVAALLIILGPLVFAVIFPAFTTDSDYRRHASPLTLYFLSPVCNYIAAYSRMYHDYDIEYFSKPVMGIDVFILFAIAYISAAVILLIWNIKKAEKLNYEYDEYIRGQLQ